MSSVSKILKRSQVSATLFPRERETGSTIPKSFNEVPGPRKIPVLGSSWKYFPLIGSWDSNKLHIAGAMKFAEYGPLVREEISSELKICHVFRAEDIELVYKTEGRYPARRSHLAVEHYRNNRPHLYRSGGLLPTNGSEWWRLRSAFQKNISALHDVRLFLPAASEIIKEFIGVFTKDNAIVDDCLPLVSRLYLELMWMFMFGKRLGSFKAESMHKQSIPSKLIDAAEMVNLSTKETDSTEKIWKIFKTPLYRKMEENLEFIERVVLDELDAVENKNNDIGNSYLIEKYFQNDSVDRKDINGMAVDLMLGSVDTTSYSTSFLLHNLSLNMDAQTKLRDEARSLLPLDKPASVSSDILNKAIYARAVLKESFRLNPISIGVSRYLQNDTVFSGYLIPKGTLMMTQNLVACRNEENFPNADAFIPERWVRGSPHHLPSISPFLVLPFSHGPRTCIARRLAEQNLLTLLILIGRKFSATWRGEQLGIVTPLICKPDKPVKIEFTSWDC